MAVRVPSGLSGAPPPRSGDTCAGVSGYEASRRLGVIYTLHAVCSLKASNMADCTAAL